MPWGKPEPRHRPTVGGSRVSRLLPALVTERDPRSRARGADQDDRGSREDPQPAFSGGVICAGLSGRRTGHGGWLPPVRVAARRVAAGRVVTGRVVTGRVGARR